MKKQQENNYFCCNYGLESGNRSELNSWRRQRPGIISWCHAPSKIVDCDPMMRGKSDGTLKPSSPPIAKHQKRKSCAIYWLWQAIKILRCFQEFLEHHWGWLGMNCVAAVVVVVCVIINFRRQKLGWNRRWIDFRWTFQSQFETNLSSSDINDCIFSCFYHFEGESLEITQLFRLLKK